MFDRLNTLIARIATLDVRREEGQAVTEYALVLAFVAVALAAVLTPLGDAITSKIGSIATAISGS
jgi:Flp pilus assembly pilin Flp